MRTIYIFDEGTSRAGQVVLDGEERIGYNAGDFTAWGAGEWVDIEFQAIQQLARAAQMECKPNAVRETAIARNVLARLGSDVIRDGWGEFSDIGDGENYQNFLADGEFGILGLVGCWAVVHANDAEPANEKTYDFAEQAMDAAEALNDDFA